MTVEKIKKKKIVLKKNNTSTSYDIDVVYIVDDIVKKMKGQLFRINGR